MKVGKSGHTDSMASVKAMTEDNIKMTTT